jgi:hypothetical protein
MGTGTLDRTALFENGEVESRNVMSNKPKYAPSPLVARGDGVNTIIVVREYDINDIIGKVLTIVESAGLPTKQEEAIKGLVRQAFWNTIDVPTRVILSETDFAKFLGK